MVQHVCLSRLFRALRLAAVEGAVWLSSKRSRPLDLWRHSDETYYRRRESCSARAYPSKSRLYGFRQRNALIDAMRHRRPRGTCPPESDEFLGAAKGLAGTVWSVYLRGKDPRPLRRSRRRFLGAGFRRVSARDTENFLARF